MKGHKIALGGSYSGDADKLFKALTGHGILQFSLIGREITLQIKSETLDEVVKSLEKHGVENVCILEWSKYGTTVAGSGASTDKNEVLNVSLIPSALGEGLKSISVLKKSEAQAVYDKLKKEVEEVLAEAGVTDILYVVQIEKQATHDEYLKAVRDATLNALFAAGGIVGIE
ncbi:MAG: hypothetical protein NTU61_04780 [Candidatus Altiarchaeota archaeon]|nr:hypothetical protein [Candidatus Altiarchaeota archaeon]